MQREIIYVTKHKVSCQGQGDDLGHPLVYLEIKDQDITCPYCSRVFKLRKNETK